MADESELKDLKGKLGALEVKVEKHDRYFWVAIVVGGIFGVTGAFGARWIDQVSTKVATADEKIDKIVTNINDQYTEAQRRAEANIDGWVRTRQNQLEIVFRNNRPRIDELTRQVNGLDSALADMRRSVDIVDGGTSKKFGGENAELFSSSCPVDHVVVGLEVWLGGTCRQQCNADGRPVSFFRVKCGRRL